MSETLLLCILLLATPFIVPGYMALVNAYYTLIQVNKGYIRVGRFLMNRRAGYRWVKPSKDKKIVLDNMAYDFNDSPDYMVSFGSFWGSIPTIFVDSKSYKQIRVFGENDSTIKPLALDGLIKLAFKTGYLEGVGATMNMKMWFIIGYVLMGIVLLATLLPTIKQAAGV